MRTSALRLYPANRRAFPTVRSRQTPLPLSQAPAAPWMLLASGQAAAKVSQRGASLVKGLHWASRAIAVIADWASTVAKQRRWHNMSLL